MNREIDISLDMKLAEGYKSPSQIARVLTEDWVRREVYCPGCANRLQSLKPNTPVGDFVCSKCHEEYELKAKKQTFCKKIVDGAWSEMNDKIVSGTSPNFFLLNYELKESIVRNFFVVPKHFLVPALIEKRKPLTVAARRAAWVGCNILLSNIPYAGRIYYIKDGIAEKEDVVLNNWKRSLFLREQVSPDKKGWTLSVMGCLDQLAKKEFTLDEVYAFEAVLMAKFPNNQHIKDKIRQQLQILRDRGYLEFLCKGRYRVI